MTRLETMARFAEPEDKEPQVLAYCENCKESLYEGDWALRDGDSLYCDDECYFENSDIKTITLGDE